MFYLKIIYERVNLLIIYLYNVKVFYDLIENDNRKNDKMLIGLRIGVICKRI